MDTATISLPASAWVSTTYLFPAETAPITTGANGKQYRVTLAEVTEYATEAPTITMRGKPLRKDGTVDEATWKSIELFDDTVGQAIIEAHKAAR